MSEESNKKTKRGAAVGTMNAYGEQKQEDGSWKYLGKEYVTKNKAEGEVPVVVLPLKSLLPKIDVKDRWASYEVFLNMVASQNSGIKSLIGYGSGGVGKTFRLKKVFDSHSLVEYTDAHLPGEAAYDYIKITGKATPVALYKALYEHNGKLVVFDDCDSVLKDEDSINILKGALDTTGDGTITYGSSRKLYDSNDEEIPQRFPFYGKIVFVSNLTSTQMPQPLRSRGLTVDLTMNASETVIMLREIATLMPFQDSRGTVIEVSVEDRLAAVEFLDKHKDSIAIGDLNARTFGQVALVKKEMGLATENVLDWETVALSMLS